MSLSSQPTLTRKEAIWLACRDKTCCATALVVPTGRDVWRIARALDVTPWSFLVYFESPVPARDAFALDHTSRRFRLALTKQRGRRAKTPPCLFLLRTRAGHHRCALGDLRPEVCRAFPSELTAGVLSLREDSGCTCRAWSLADVDIEEERAAVEARQAAAEEYCQVVAWWNAHVGAAPAEAQFDFFDYCRFLLDAYDDIARSAVALTAAPAAPRPAAFAVAGAVGAGQA